MSDPFGIGSSKKAAEAQEEATELQRQQNNLASARRRRETIREARVNIAQSTQAAASQGSFTSSAAQGGLRANQTQFLSNLSFLDNQNLLVDQTSAAIGRQRKFEAKAARSRALTSGVLSVARFGASFI